MRPDVEQPQSEPQPASPDFVPGLQQAALREESEQPQSDPQHSLPDSTHLQPAPPAAPEQPQSDPQPPEAPEQPQPDPQHSSLDLDVGPQQALSRGVAAVSA